MARFNTDNSTNAALAVMAAIEIFEKLSGHPIPIDAKATLLEIFVGVGLWFTGKPSPTTGKILQHLGLKNDLVNDVAGDRGGNYFPGVGTSGPTPDLERFGATPRRGNEQFGGTTPRGGNAGLNADTLEAIANDVGDYGTRRPSRNPVAWVSASESIPPNSDRAKAAAAYAADVAMGRAASPEQMNEFLAGGDDDDNSYSTPVQGGGEWQN